VPDQEDPVPSTEQPPVVIPPVRGRLTVVGSIYHQPADGFPSTLLGDAVRFHHELQSDEQPYERHKIAKEQWEPLDCGWVEKTGMLLIRNDEGHFAVNPTPEQQNEVGQRVIEVVFSSSLTLGNPSGECLLVPPGETYSFYPSDATQLRLRCREGVARYTICLVPE
jgi:hypothetical protein